MDIFIKFRSDEKITKKSVYDIISITKYFFQLKLKIENYVIRKIYEKYFL